MCCFSECRYIFEKAVDIVHNSAGKGQRCIDVVFVQLHQTYTNYTTDPIKYVATPIRGHAEEDTFLAH